nr:uncharacterized protein LOC111428879 [Onthophagus taurus]
MRESRCPTDSSVSNDREEKNPVSRGSHLLSDICKYLDVSPNNKNRKSSSPPRENVELGLEIEINESLKRVLTTPNSGSDDLLDVTIIRPSESDVTHETTVALNKDEVRDFISLVEQHHQNKLKSGKSKKGVAKKSDVPDHIPSTKQKVISLKNEIEENRNEKPGTPCVCQHCGIMGVLVQSNKAEIRKDKSNRDDKEDKDDKRGRRERSPDQPRSSKDFKNQRSVVDANTKSQDQLTLLREINSRIKDLEKRITVQEENAVPRDYLKHVLHKLLSQYKDQQKPQNLRNTGTQYIVEHKEKYPQQAPQQVPQQPTKKDGKSRHYQVHTLLHTTTAPTGIPKLGIGEPSTTSHNTSTDLGISSGSKLKKQPLYFWGEEVVSPGCDLKTKILNLLDEKMGNKNVPQSRIPIALPEKLPKTAEEEIKVERDENLLFLGKMDEISPCNIDDYVQRSRPPEIIRAEKNVAQQNNYQNGFNVVPESLRPDLKMKHNQMKPNPPSYVKPPNLLYPFDPKRTLDDSTFRRNIDAHKERLREKPKMPEKFFNGYLTQSGSSESKASMDMIMQKIRHNNQVVENKEKEKKVAEEKYKMSHYEKLASSIIKEKMTCGGFRTTKGVVQETNSFSVPVDITYVNPKITQWSEESTASEDRYMKFMKPNQRKDSIPVETKESLIYKLEFLKNLAKHKSADQSKVLNKIWTQAKKTAKSKNDAVFIKIPFKSVNTVEPRNNVIEMQLTLEQLETVVKSVKVNDSTTKMIAKYKSSSEIDIGQRQHEEIRKANMEVLNKRRNFSAKSGRKK